jgi:glycosyltransferase involved in cell wall biosynthesis
MRPISAATPESDACGIESTTSTDRVDVTILMPCLNERITLPACIDTAEEAARMLVERGLVVEILVSDNGSADGSQSYAASRGCRLTHCPTRGYGAALIHGIEAAQGRFIVMGDSDASYDFREGVAMIEALASGYDICMGNRFTGRILPGAMPPLNRYLGNPLLSGLLNFFYRSGVGDAHSGLRAFRRDAALGLGLITPGMEFASELVVKAALKGLRMTERPITLHPDGRDRKPHLRPWRDGWRHLRFLLALTPMWLFVIPSLVLLATAAAIAGVLLTTLPGDVFRLGGFWIGDHWLILAAGMANVALGGLTLGTIARVWASKRGFRDRSRRLDRWVAAIRTDTTVLVGFVMACLGALLLAAVLFDFLKGGFGDGGRIRETVIGTTLITGGIQVIFASFVVSLIDDELPAISRQEPPGDG